jgi:hypothetical protein
MIKKATEQEQDISPPRKRRTTRKAKTICGYAEKAVIE